MQCNHRLVQRIVRRNRSAARARRRGVLSLALVVLLLVAIATALLVLNWSYLVLAQRQLQHRADLLALAGAPGLLHPSLLVSGATTAASDAVSAAQAEVDSFRAANNVHLARRWHLAPSDVRLTPGHLVAAANAPAGFVPLDEESRLPLALRVEVERGRAQGNPLGWLLGGTWLRGPSPRVLAESIAALDGQVIGFRPRADLPAPVAPLAIELATWRKARVSDQNSNQIREFELQVPISSSSTSTSSAGSATLVSFHGAVQRSVVERQCRTGVTLGDLPPASGVLGPALAASPLKVKSQGVLSPALANALATELNALAAQPASGRRVWPIFDANQSSGGRAALVGFVAGRVLRAERRGALLSISLEPCFLIHTTAWTAAGAGSIASPPLVYRLALAR